MYQTVRLNPSFSPITEQYFVSPNVFPPMEFHYGEEDPLVRNDHFSSYLAVGEVVPLRHVVALPCNNWTSADGIDISRIFIKDVLIKVTAGDKSEVLELNGIFGVAGTAFLPSPDMSYGTREAYLSMKHLAARCFKRVDRCSSTIFDGVEAPNITFNLGLKYDNITGVVETISDHAKCSVKDYSVQVIGYMLDLTHTTTDVVR